ncbi:hypothetical protein GCM10009846_19200 [Agrococcus versicolor]|uniref:SHSP domain-containing protein n=1 Tax=Agrococcus versicolor TaxID=501482 RepID=A0ABP5MHS1_9MICO
MVDERQPRIVEGRALERDARRGLPDGVDPAALADGPVVVRRGTEHVIVVLRAPSDAAPLAVTTRARDGVVDAVFQPTLRRGPRAAATTWHYVLRLPAAVEPDAALTVRIVGLGDAVEVAVPAA